MEEESTDKYPITLGAIFKIFAKMGIIGFGGPAAHIAMFEREIVTERKWISEDEFIDLLGATNLIPGPNSTEMGIHLGYVLKGWRGMFVAGLSFLFPAIFMTLILAILYVQFGTEPQFIPALLGIRAVVISIIAGAVWRLGKKTSKTWVLFSVSVLTGIMVIYNLNPILALFSGAFVGIIGGKLLGSADVREESITEVQSLKTSLIIGICCWILLGGFFLGMTLLTDDLIWEVGLFFFIIGSVLYGSGYVLFAFLEDGIVNERGWLTLDQLLDAIAFGQFTPGPVLSTSTFIGYVIGGISIAIIATIGIFGPSFIFVTILNPIIPQLRKSELLSYFLDGINAAALGVIGAVTVEITRQVIFPPGNLIQDVLVPIAFIPGSIILLILSLVAVLKYNISTFYIVIGGAIGGVILQLLDLFEVISIF